MQPCFKLIGRDGEIRTHDLLLPKQTRYQAALRLERTLLTRSQKVLIDLIEINHQERVMLRGL